MGTASRLYLMSRSEVSSVSDDLMLCLRRITKQVADGPGQNEEQVDATLGSW